MPLRQCRVAARVPRLTVIGTTVPDFVSVRIVVSTRPTCLREAKICPQLCPYRIVFSVFLYPSWSGERRQRSMTPQDRSRIRVCVENAKADFKSCASASFATPARGISLDITCQGSLKMDDLWRFVPIAYRQSLQVSFVTCQLINAGYSHPRCSRRSNVFRRRD
jgi:hypothetical protein